LIKIVLATSNRGKQKEIQAFLNKDVHKNSYEVIPYSDLVDEFEIEETGSTFKENAIIKANAVFDALDKNNKIHDNIVVLAEDSGISIKALNNEPNIFSARYSGENATDKTNIQKVIDNLNNLNLSESEAFYTSSIALIINKNIQTVHGWLHGKVINQAKGTNGFGYDPIFIPTDLSLTLGELENSKKEQYSHRIKALNLAKILIESKF
jgi:XTP/dITP diphosphohydrolase